MKIVIKIGLLSSLLLILILIYSVLLNQTVRSGELNEGLKRAVEQSVKVVFLNDDFYSKMKKVSSLNNVTEEKSFADEVTSLFCNELINHISSYGEISVKLVDYDIESGLFDFYIVEEFTYPNGFDGYIDYRRTIICEEE